MPEPKRTQLRRILEEHPEARPRVKRAVANLLGVWIASFGVIGLLLIWHLRRRRQLILERLGRPRAAGFDERQREDGGESTPRTEPEPPRRLG